MNATVVARVIDAHTPTGSGGDITCWCNQRFESWAEHSMHVAAAVLASLDLREETLMLNEHAAANGETPEIQRRWVSSWTSGSDG